MTDTSLSVENRDPKKALRFVLLLGVVSLFADMTYESARSLAGPYLAILGATGTVVGFTAGIGELLGYSLRLFFGLLSDKTQRYWMFTLVGYAVNLMAVPLLALTHHWETAIVLMMVERIGKAVRAPARDVMLSYAAASIGRGWAFAVHEAMDQIGAMVGPIIVMVVLAVNGSYRFAYAVLAIPAVLALAVLIAARISFPHPQKLENNNGNHRDEKLPSVFWMYIAAICLLAAGFADYPLIAFHIKSHSILADPWIPLLYSVAMGVDALSALFFGRLYDKKGVFALAAAIVVSSCFALPVFSLTPWLLVVGMVLWGIGMGAQESILRAVVADIVPVHRRGAGYGLFNACFGMAWFIGSMVMGVLYDFSLPVLIAFSMLCQVASAILLFALQKRLSMAR